MSKKIPLTRFKAHNSSSFSEVKIKGKKTGFTGLESDGFSVLILSKTAQA